MRLYFLAAGCAALQVPMRTVRMMGTTLPTTAQVKPVKAGAVVGAAVEASTLWSPKGAVVFVVRRPG